MNNNQVELSISIVNTNNKKLLEPCLKSIYENTKRVSFEIIVVDNYSTDGSAEMVRDLFPDVKLICQDSRKGYGFNHNRAYEQSCGNYFLVFNEDMYVLPEALDNMMDIMKKENTIGALGCKTLSANMAVRYNDFRFPEVFSVLFDNLVPSIILPRSRFRSKYFHGRFDEERDVDVIAGCCMLIPREVIEKIGLFDERFFIYSEETDLCKRIKQGGWRVHYTPKGEVIHYGGQTSKTMSLKMSIIMIESKIKYFKKHHNILQVYCFIIANLFGFTLRLIGWNIAKLLRLKDKELAKTKINNYWKMILWLMGLNKIQ